MISIMVTINESINIPPVKGGFLYYHAFIIKAFH